MRRSIFSAPSHISSGILSDSSSQVQVPFKWGINFSATLWICSPVSTRDLSMDFRSSLSSCTGICRQRHSLSIFSCITVFRQIKLKGERGEAVRRQPLVNVRRLLTHRRDSRLRGQPDMHRHDNRRKVRLDMHRRDSRRMEQLDMRRRGSRHRVQHCKKILSLKLLL